MRRRSAGAARPAAATGGAVSPSSRGSEAGTASWSTASGAFVTGIGAGTTYPDYKPAPFIVSSKHRRRRHGHRRDRGHLQLLRRQGEDRHRPPSRARAGGGARRGRGDRPRHHRRIRLADAVARRRASPDRRPQEGGRRHLRRAARRCATSEPVELAIDGGATVVVQAGKPPVVNGKREERMRVGCGSATIGMFAPQWHGPCRRGGRGRRPHHRRAVRAPGRPLPRHEARRHPRARPHARRPAAISRSPSRASAGAAPTSPIRWRSSRRSIPSRRWPGLTLLMVSTTGEQFA